MRGPKVIKILNGSSGVYESFMISNIHEEPLPGTSKAEEDCMEIPKKRPEPKHRPVSCPRLYPVLPMAPPSPPPKKDWRKKRRNTPDPLRVTKLEMTVPSAPPVSGSFQVKRRPLMAWHRPRLCHPQRDVRDQMCWRSLRRDWVDKIIKRTVPERTWTYNWLKPRTF